MEKDNIFDMYDKYIKPTEVKVEEPETDKLFEVKDEPNDETAKEVIQNIDEWKASIVAELKEVLLKEFEVNKTPKEE